MKCIVNERSIKSAVTLSGVSKRLHEIVNSQGFFSNLLRLIDSGHPYLRRKWEAITFKGMYFESRRAFLITRETFPIKHEIFSAIDPACTKKGILANRDNLVFLSCKNGMSINPLQATPEAVYLNIPGNASFKSLKVMRTDLYLAVNIGPSQPVYVYTSDGKRFLGEYKVEEVLQFSIVGHLLYIIDKTINLVVYNLEAREERPLEMALFDQMPEWGDQQHFFFLKDFLVYTPHKALEENKFVLPLASLKTGCSWVEVDLQGKAWYPVGDGFIEIGPHDEINKVVILEDSFIRKKIDEQKVTISLTSICSENRLFCAEKSSTQIQIRFHDFITGKFYQLLSIPDKSPVSLYYRSSLHCVANKVYYLLQKAEDKLELITLTFGKL